MGAPLALATDYRYVAHQGKVSGEYKGNTIPAFEQAAAAEGIFGLETDIWRTADGEYVCLHGEDSGEASGGDTGATWAGMNIWNTPSSELLAETVDGYALPTLGEYLDICKAGGKYAFIEIKNPELAEDERYAAEVVDIVHEHGMLDQCVFVSWRGRAMAVHYLKDYAKSAYGVDALGHIGSGRTNELVDESIAMAQEYGLDGIGTYPDIPQQEYAYEQLKGTGLKLRSTGALKDETHARELIERYDLWAAYSEFCPETYAVKFVDGTTGETLARHRYAYGATPQAPGAPEHDGYEFLGWDTALSPVKGSTTITARYQFNGCTVFFDANGGVGQMADQRIFSAQPAYLMPNAFTRVGYTFKGWALLKDADPLYPDTAEIKNPGYVPYLVLYAQWQKAA